MVAYTRPLPGRVVRSVSQAMGSPMTSATSVVTMVKIRVL